jgi:hypothetical protein
MNPLAGTVNNILEQHFSRDDKSISFSLVVLVNRWFIKLCMTNKWRRITITDKFCERWKLILATIKVKICSKERMTKNWWLFINKLNNKKLWYSFWKSNVYFIVFEYKALCLENICCIFRCRPSTVINTCFYVY